MFVATIILSLRVRYENQNVQTAFVQNILLILQQRKRKNSIITLLHSHNFGDNVNKYILVFISKYKNTLLEFLNFMYFEALYNAFWSNLHDSHFQI